MKTLIINGSPRKQGDTAAMLTALTQRLGGEIITVNTYYDGIKPCDDCRYCWTEPGCAIDDGMQDIYRALKDADAVVIASPIYFSELTGSLLNFASRLQFFYASRAKRKDADFSIKRKNGLLILAGGGDGSPNPAIATAKALFHQMNAEMLACVCSLKTDDTPAKDDTEALVEIERAAQILVEG